MVINFEEISVGRRGGKDLNANAAAVHYRTTCRGNLNKNECVHFRFIVQGKEKETNNTTSEKAFLDI